MPYRWPGVWVTSRSVTVSEIFQSLIQTLLVHKEQHDLSSLDMKYPPPQRLMGSKTGSQLVGLLGGDLDPVVTNITTRSTHCGVHG